MDNPSLVKGSPKRLREDENSYDRFVISHGRLYRVVPWTGVVGACHLEEGDGQRKLYIENTVGIYDRVLGPDEDLLAAVVDEGRKTYFNALGMAAYPMARIGRPDARKFSKWRYAYMMQMHCSSFTIDEQARIYVHKAKEGNQRVVGRGSSGIKLRSCYLQSDPSKEFVIRKIKDRLDSLHVCMAFELFAEHPFIEHGRCFLRATQGGFAVYSSLVPRYYGCISELIEKQQDKLHQSVMTNVLLRCSWQFVQSIAYLHGRGWLHGALMPEHLLVDYDPEQPMNCSVKLSSFRKLKAVMSQQQRQAEQERAAQLVSFILDYAEDLPEDLDSEIGALDFSALRKWLETLCAQRQVDTGYALLSEMHQEAVHGQTKRLKNAPADSER